MNEPNYLIAEIIRVMDELDRRSRGISKPEVDRDALERGFDSSYKASKQETEVAMTPLMKNALERFGDKPKDDDTWRLKVGDAPTKAEKWFYEAMKLLLTKFNGSKTEYDENLPLLSVDHYNVQCWQNLKENMRDIQPGQADERLKASEEYTRATETVGVRKMLESDPIFQKAVEWVFKMLPDVKASNKFTEINLPFMTKHTNVGYPYWQNDRNLVPGTSQTYAQLTMKEAERTPVDRLNDYNISTMYGRNQRGKGRLLIAVSRIVNLSLNRLEAEEIKAYKAKCPLFLGYKDDAALKLGLSQMVNYANEHGLKMRNNDQSRFDRHVSYEFILLMNAIRCIKAQGVLSRQLAYKRAELATRTWLINGLTNNMEEIYGRIFSGFIDTNAGGGIINAIITTYCVMKQDAKYSEHVNTAPYYMLVMGDDNNFLYSNLDHKQFEDDMKSIGFEVNMDKDEFGPMFLQYRLFEDPETHEQVMSYPWTRVVRSMLFKEAGKGLGPAGWYIAWLQQMQKCIEFKPAFKIIVNLLIQFDNNHFFTDKSISEIIRMMNEEDAEKLAQAKTEAQRRRVESSFLKLYDGDPSKSRFHESLEKGGKGLLEDLHEAVKQAVDPQLLKSVGIAAPAR